jgi:hypothetical protein
VRSRPQPRILKSAFRPRKSLPTTQFSREPPMDCFTFRRRISSISSDATVTFRWSEDIEEILIATDVREAGYENCEAVGYIGSGHTKTAIYVSIKSLISDLTNPTFRLVSEIKNMQLLHCRMNREMLNSPCRLNLSSCCRAVISTPNSLNWPRI